jgi:hypothetical protein
LVEKWPPKRNMCAQFETAADEFDDELLAPQMGTRRAGRGGPETDAEVTFGQGNEFGEAFGGEDRDGAAVRQEHRGWWRDFLS